MSRRFTTAAAIVLLIGLLKWISLEARFGFGPLHAARALLAFS